MLNVFSRFFLSSLLLSGVVQANDTIPDASDAPNFAFGLGYGLLDQKSLLNIDFKVNIPISERFSTQVGSGGVEVIDPANSRRYEPLVRLIESVDSGQAVAVYRTLYPLFQQAYEALGFPNAYFNDRLVQVIDHLIATPVPIEPPAVALVAVKGSVPSLRPWVRYEFVDPELEGLSAGRKILIRVGAENQRRLQAKLKDLRARVAKAP